MIEEAPRVFVSYSHDSPEHRDRVLGLANRLRENGVDAWVDRYVQAPAAGWPRWTREQLNAARFVLCVCTSRYCRSFEGRHDPDGGLGVNHEGALITQELYNRGHRSGKYVPVLFDPRDESHIPDDLGGFMRFRLPQQYEALYRLLTHQPEVVATSVGPVRKLPGRVAGLDPLSDGNPQQSEATDVLEPEHFALEALAPTDGLFVSRLINPPVRGAEDSVTTVWIAARGPRQYILDSISIQDFPGGGLGGWGAVAVEPDAQYSFQYSEGCDLHRPLQPALSVGPHTRRVASFTVSLTAPQGFYHTGLLRVAVHYHDSEGCTGTLQLISPPFQARRLASLLGADVLFTMRSGDAMVDREATTRTILVTADGTQEGFGDQPPPALRYQMLMPKNFSASKLGEEARRILQDREALHRALEEGDRLPELEAVLTQTPLFESFAEDSPPDASDRRLHDLWLEAHWAADLLGGIAGPRSTRALLERLQSDPRDPVGLHGLCVRHLAAADGLLADHVLDHFAAETLQDPPADHPPRPPEGVLETLLARPAGNWLEAAEKFVSRIELLRSLHDRLTSSERRRLLDGPSGPLEAEVYLRGTMNGWEEPPPQEYCFRYLSKGAYALETQLTGAAHELKLGGRGWSPNWGGAQEGDRLRLGMPYLLCDDPLSRNLTLDLGGETPGTFRFTFDLTDPHAPSLTVEKAVPE